MSLFARGFAQLQAINIEIKVSLFRSSARGERPLKKRLLRRIWYPRRRIGGGDEGGRSRGGGQRLWRIKAQWRFISIQWWMAVEVESADVAVNKLNG